MKINRHNYEEFFLLYVDKELSAAKRKAVEVFVQSNPDLEEELLMLQQSVVLPDVVTFDAKRSLLKEESTTPLQEKLLLLADDELPRAEKDAVLKLLSTDAAAAKEWNILQQTKLQADNTVVFADKKSLYRKEQAEVVTIKWWRVAAAAIFIGLGIWGVVAVYNNNAGKTTSKENMARGNDNKDKQQQPIAKQPVTNPAADNTNAPKENVVNNTQQQVAVTAPQKNSTPQKVTDKNKAAVKDNNEEDNAVPKENMAAVNNDKELNKKPSNNLPTPLYNNINNEARNKNTLAAVPHSDEDAGTDPKKGIALAGNGLQDKLKGVDPTTNPIAKTAVYNENENVPYIDTDNKKRSKLGGFLRKVTRVIARTTNGSASDGKSVKIAGFDIAIN
jgi:hypothetical protein